MPIIKIADSPTYDDTYILMREVSRLGKNIKRNISRLIAFRSRDTSLRSAQLADNCRYRILSSLQQISQIREVKIWNEEKWNTILKWSLIPLYKHTNTPETQQKINTLIAIDTHDISKTGIHFLQAYMRIVARIPEDQINLPFHQ